MEDNKEQKPIKAQVAKPMQSFKVLKEFTGDKLYKFGTTFESNDKKVIEKLTAKKYIK